jgi:hypothetical protein
VQHSGTRVARAIGPVVLAEMPPPWEAGPGSAH